MLSPLINRHLESKIIVLLFIMVKFAKCAKKYPTLLLLPEGGSKMYLTDTLHLSCAEYKYKFEKKKCDSELQFIDPPSYPWQLFPWHQLLCKQKDCYYT